MGISKLVGEIYSIKKSERKLNLRKKHYIWDPKNRRKGKKVACYLIMVILGKIFWFKDTKEENKR